MRRSMILVLFCMMLLAGCAEKAETANPKSTCLTVTAENGTISIARELLSEDVLYVNFDSSGTQMQLLAGIASDGTCRASLNTCQSCSPSPKAYFRQENGKLVCQNCGNQFTMDNVGQKAAGCNPTYIETSQTDTAIIIDEQELNRYSFMFTNWQGITD